MNFYIQQSSIYEASTSPSFNMLSPLMFLVILKGFSCEELTPVETEENSVEDTTVTMSYNYYQAATYSDYFFWYRQDPGKPPEFLIVHSGTQHETSSRLSAKVSDDKTRMDLKISSATVSDSAVYYCAVKPNTGLNKILFGTGTSLTIEPKTVSKPSFYKLSGDGTSACLASDFSRKKAAEEQHAIFSRSAAVLVEKVSLYNQLVLLTSEGEEEACEQAEDDSDVCGEPVKPDGRVNLMSVTMLGLRLLFFKTVVFNVLMTLRLWISQ